MFGHEDFCWLLNILNKYTPAPMRREIEFHLHLLFLYTFTPVPFLNLFTAHVLIVDRLHLRG